MKTMMKMGCLMVLAIWTNGCDVGVSEEVMPGELTREQARMLAKADSAVACNEKWKNDDRECDADYCSNWTREQEPDCGPCLGIHCGSACVRTNGSTGLCDKWGSCYASDGPEDQRPCPAIVNAQDPQCENKSCADNCRTEMVGGPAGPIPITGYCTPEGACQQAFPSCGPSPECNDKVCGMFCGIDSASAQPAYCRDSRECKPGAPKQAEACVTPPPANSFCATNGCGTKCVHAFCSGNDPFAPECWHSYCDKYNQCVPMPRKPTHWDCR